MRGRLSGTGPGIAMALVLAVTVGCAGSAGRPAGAQPAAPVKAAAPREASIDASVEAAARTLVGEGARSAVVAVRQDGRIRAAADPPVAAPAARPFRIGSVTKMFTATIVLRLVERGRVGLDVPARRYLGSLRGLDGRVTIRQLLQHRSGVPDFAAYPDWLRMADASSSIGPRDVVRFALSHPMLFPPGTQWRYSNTNYVLLGLVVEAVTHRRFADELAREITVPLGLTATRLPRTRTVPGLTDGGINPGVPWAAGAIVSTAGDVARFLSALLSGRLLDRARLAEMERTVPTPLGVGYGLGLMGTSLSCGTAWGHTGGTLDYETQAWAHPDGRRVLVIFTRDTRAHAVPDRSLLCP